MADDGGFESDHGPEGETRHAENIRISHGACSSASSMHSAQHRHAPPVLQCLLHGRAEHGLNARYGGGAAASRMRGHMWAWCACIPQHMVHARLQSMHSELALRLHGCGCEEWNLSTRRFLPTRQARQFVDVERWKYGREGIQGRQGIMHAIPIRSLLPVSALSCLYRDHCNLASGGIGYGAGFCCGG